MKSFLPVFLLLCLPAYAQTNDFRPLPKLTPPQSGNIYVAADPNTFRYGGSGPMPTHAVWNGRIVPLTNLVQTASNNTNAPNPFPSIASPYSQLSAGAKAELTNAVTALNNIRVQQPGRIMHAQQAITAANMQPEVQKKLQAIRKLIRDYINTHSPTDVETVEIMAKPKDVMEHNGLPGNLVY